MSDQPHDAFVDAARYVRAYLDQLSRLLNDVTVALGRREFRILRPNGGRYLSNLDALANAPYDWLPNWMFAFFAPAHVFGGASYGVDAAHVPIVPFMGVVLEDEHDTPEMWVGWVKGHDGQGTLETKLKTLCDQIHPPSLEPPPRAVSSLDELSLTAVPVAETNLQIALGRVPLFLLMSQRDAHRLANTLAEAVLEEQRSPS